MYQLKTMSTQTSQESKTMSTQIPPAYVIRLLELKVKEWRIYLTRWEEAEQKCKRREEEARTDLAMFEKVEREETDPAQKLVFQEIVTQYRDTAFKERLFLARIDEGIRAFTIKLLDSLAELANAMNRAHAAPSVQ
jgi:hypothetical protein